jgi:two-component system heavy metal sensor histidine kinase CusS
MSFKNQSISFRITVLFGTISTLVLLVLGMLIGHTVNQHFVQQDSDIMTGKLDLVAHLLEKVKTPSDLDSLPLQLIDSLVGHHGIALLVQDAQGRTLFATQKAVFPKSFLQNNANMHALQSEVWQQMGPTGEIPMRGIATTLPVAIPDYPPLRVAIAVDISQHGHFMASFQRTLWLFVAIAAVLAGFLGWIAVRRGLAPLQAIRQGAANVTASRLNYRLAVDSVPAELAELVQTLNDMLARLDDSFTRLKDFSSDLAHELRTPISNLMTETQVALTRTRSIDEYRDVLASNAEEYEHLARMIGDMLFLAQSDNGLIVPRREPVDLLVQVSELFDFFEALADEKKLRLSLTGSATVSGDKLMLRRALANLLSNAIRHASEGGRIEVRIKSTSEGVTLAVENTGEPVAKEHLTRIFDRFYRADPSRHRSGEGAGLGLAITRSIIQAHGGEINAQSSDDGVCFVMQIP